MTFIEQYQRGGQEGGSSWYRNVVEWQSAAAVGDDDDGASSMRKEVDLERTRDSCGGGPRLDLQRQRPPATSKSSRMEGKLDVDST